MLKRASIFLLLLFPVFIHADDEQKEIVLTEFARPETIPFPADNPYTLEKAALGKMLFFDQRMSKGQNISCASCHNPSFGWEVPFAKALGSQNTELPRHANTVLNLAWGKHFFWDGRADSLEAQARGPIEDPKEMANTMDVIVQRLSQIEEYNQWFKQAFPKEGLTENNVLKAIATYERTLISSEAPFDKWIAGDETAISEEAKSGFRLFVGKAKCIACHTGWNFTDNEFHDIGLFDYDEGRAAITNISSQSHAFKTPGLRNISQRAPYMHNGSLANLKSVMAHYIGGGVQRPSLSKEMQPLDLNQKEIREIILFLESLTGNNNVVALPILPN